MDKSKLQIEEQWLKRFVDSMEPEYKKDIAQFVDDMEQ